MPKNGANLGVNSESAMLCDYNHSLEVVVVKATEMCIQRKGEWAAS